MEIQWTSKDQKFCIIENANGLNALIAFEIQSVQPPIKIEEKNGHVIFANRQFNVVADYFLKEWSTNWEEDSKDFLAET